MTGQRRAGQRRMENVRELSTMDSTHPCANKASGLRLHFIFKKKESDEMLAKTRERMNNGSFFIILQNSVPHANSWRGKPFVLAVSKCQFPSWSPRSLSCCQKQESVCQPLCPGVCPCPDRDPLTVNQPVLTGEALGLAC